MDTPDGLMGRLVPVIRRSTTNKVSLMITMIAVNNFISNLMIRKKSRKGAFTNSKLGG
jgi:hypothetical protein